MQRYKINSMRHSKRRDKPITTLYFVGQVKLEYYTGTEWVSYSPDVIPTGLSETVHDGGTVTFDPPIIAQKHRMYILPFQHGGLRNIQSDCAWCVVVEFDIENIFVALLEGSYSEEIKSSYYPDE